MSNFRTEQTIPPVFVLSTGRCGSTMVSNLLNLHPRVLSLSELNAFTGLTAFAAKRRSGEWMWNLLGKQRNHTRLMLQGNFDELLYPFDTPGARFTRADVPPIMCATIPHLTPDHDTFFDEMEPAVRSLPTQSPSQQYRDIFEWLCARFGRVAWVERSGASLLSTAILLKYFPDARVIHIYRDGRDVALSMSRHDLFRMVVATLTQMRVGSVDLLNLARHDWIWEQIVTRATPVLSRFALHRNPPYDNLDLAHFGEYWSRMIEHGARVLERLPHGQLLNVRFEDVQADPEGQVRRLIRFISPELEDDDWVRRASAIPRPTRSRFHDLDSQVQDRLTAACRPGLELMGYELQRKTGYADIQHPPPAVPAIYDRHVKEE